MTGQGIVKHAKYACHFESGVFGRMRNLYLLESVQLKIFRNDNSAKVTEKSEICELIWLKTNKRKIFYNDV